MIKNKKAIFMNIIFWIMVLSSIYGITSGFVAYKILDKLKSQIIYYNNVTLR